MNRGQKIRAIFAVLRLAHPEIAAGDLLRLSAFIAEAAEDELIDDPVLSNDSRYSYARPVDHAIADGGWHILFNERRQTTLWLNEEYDAADDTAMRLRPLIGRVKWPRIVRLD